MDNKLVSLSILFVLISLLLTKHLKYHLCLIIFLSVLLIYLIHLKLIIYLDNENFHTITCNSEINIGGDINLDPKSLEKIMNKLNKFNNR